MNQSVLTGFICRDARLYQTDDGTSTTEFTLAVKRKLSRETDYIPCVARGCVAEHIVSKTRKGDKIGVAGRIEAPSWTDDDGTKRCRIYVMVHEVDLPPIKKEDRPFIQEKIPEI